MNPLKRALHTAGRAYINRIVASEVESHKPKRVNERSVELAFVFRWLNLLQPRTVLDVGSGASPLPALVANAGIRITAIDNVTDYWPNGMINRHWRVLDESITSLKNLAGSHFDLVLCVSTLEHIAQHERAVKNMLSLGSHVLITCPYGDARPHPNVYLLPGSYGAGNPYPAAQYDRATLDSWLGLGAEVVEQEFWQAHESDYWSVGELVRPIRRVSREERHQLTCLLLRSL
jgi:hypothetical protein